VEPARAGLLAGVLGDQGRRPPAPAAQPERIEQHRPALQAYEDACREWGLAPADVALAWLLHRDGVTAPIVGPRTMAQLEGSLAALDVTLEQAQLDRLDEVFPGFRAAPVEYAW
jgi:aryl-alcohol dehydrogenase-like predicted oxidoreductase